MTSSHLRQYLSRIHPWMVTLAVCLIYLAIVFAGSHANPTVFVTLTRPPSAEHPEGVDGYDGQFTYYIAVDPISSPAHLDVPAYRLQRVLLPFLGHILALGQIALIPWTLLLVNVSSLVAGVFFLEKLLQAEKIGIWYALIYGLFAGVLMPVRTSLNEPLAYGLVILAIWLERRDHLWWSAAAFAAATLAKETALIAVAGYLLWMAFERRWRDALRLGAIACIPFVLWQGALYLWLGSLGIGSGGDLSTPFEIIPFMGFFRIYTETGSIGAFLAFAVVLVPVVIFPSLWGIARSVRDVVRRSWHPYSFLLLTNAAIIATTPFSTFREPLGILRFMPGLVITTLLYSAHYRKKRMLAYSLLWLATGALAVVSG